jgi:hypothetical protein
VRNAMESFDKSVDVKRSQEATKVAAVGTSETNTTVDAGAKKAAAETVMASDTQISAKNALSQSVDRESIHDGAEESSKKEEAKSGGIMLEDNEQQKLVAGTTNTEKLSSNPKNVIQGVLNGGNREVDTRSFLVKAVDSAEGRHDDGPDALAASQKNLSQNGGALSRNGAGKEDAHMLVAKDSNYDDNDSSDDDEGAVRNPEKSTLGTCPAPPRAQRIPVSFSAHREKVSTGSSTGSADVNVSISSVQGTGGPPGTRPTRMGRTLVAAKEPDSSAR